MAYVLKKIKECLARICRLASECGQSIAVYVLLLTLVSAVGASALYAAKDNVDHSLDLAEKRIENTNIGSNHNFIEVEPLKSLGVSASDYSGEYDGSMHTGSVQVSDPASGYTIHYGETEGSYTLSTAPHYSTVGNRTVYFRVSAEGYREYLGSFSVSITTRYVSTPSVSGSFTYDGSSKSATISDFNGVFCSKSGTSSATNAGTYSITFSLNDTSNMKWSDGTTADKTYGWTIAKRSLSDAVIAAVSDQNWTGSAITPTPAVTCNGRTLTNGTDFTYRYANNTSAGTATITAAAVTNGNYTGSKSATFTIKARTMTVSASNYSGTYDGFSHTGSVTVTVPNSGATIYYGTSASACTSTSPIYRANAGTQTVYFKVTATNYEDYTGSFTISISKAKISTVPSTSRYYYTGYTITPTWSNYSSSQLTIGGTYYASAVGTYIATFTPTSNYTWSDGSTSAKSVYWYIVSGSGTRYFNPTMYGADRNGGSMNVTYHIREDWNYATNSSVVQIEWIRFDYFTNASFALPRQSTGTVGPYSYGFSAVYLNINNAGYEQLLFIPDSSSEYMLPFNGNSSTYLYNSGGVMSFPSTTVYHDSNGNASIKIGAYWSWGTTYTYPRDTRGGINGGANFPSVYEVQVNLTDTKP